MSTLIAVLCFSISEFLPGTILKNMHETAAWDSGEGGRWRWYWLYSLQHMGLSCPMCTYLPPLLSSNYAEQTKLSAFCCKSASLSFDCCTPDGRRQMICFCHEMFVANSQNPFLNVYYPTCISVIFRSQSVFYSLYCYLKAKLAVYLKWNQICLRKSIGDMKWNVIICCWIELK